MLPNCGLMVQGSGEAVSLSVPHNAAQVGAVQDLGGALRCAGHVDDGLSLVCQRLHLALAPRPLALQHLREQWTLEFNPQKMWMTW